MLVFPTALSLQFTNEMHLSFLRQRFACAVVLLALPLAAQTTSNVTVRIMAANLTSGADQRYETPGLNILKGLKPDIVAIQEFNVSNSFGINTALALSNLVATTFGTNFSYYREPNAGYSIPNGIISRYPIAASGSWTDSDTGVNDRGFAWARLDIPGTNDLYVVSVHLKAGENTRDPTDASRRAAQAAELKNLISTNFPASAWITVAGDMNLYAESEGAITTFKTFLSDSPVPADQSGDSDTNLGRTERYDRVLPSFSMTNLLVPVVYPSRTFNNGLVFDSRNYTPLSDVSPVVLGDSIASGMQHMGVLKAFQISFVVTNPIAPVITNQPQSLSVAQGNNATFAVIAGGTAPLRYQWRFASTNIVGATNSTYTRTNVQLVHSGSYLVVITNSVGSVTSAPASLTLQIPPPVLNMVSRSLLRWDGLSNLAYTVQSRTNLTQTNWPTLGTAISPSRTIWFTNPASTNDLRLFRVTYP